MSKEVLLKPDCLKLGQLGLKHQQFLSLKLPALGLKLNTIGFPGSPVGRLQILRFLSLYNHMSQFLITRLSRYNTHTLTHIGSVSPENPD